MEQRLSVREMAVHGADPHPGVFNDRIPSRFTTDFEDEPDRDIEETLTVPTRISTHRIALDRAEYETEPS
jgi:hypothetical protein